MLFPGKLFSLKNEEPHYKVGPKEGTQEREAETRAHTQHHGPTSEGALWTFRDAWQPEMGQVTWLEPLTLSEFETHVPARMEIEG